MLLDNNGRIEKANLRMVGSKDNIAVFIGKFLEEHGIDPYYAVIIFGILIALSYWNYF